MIDRNFLKVKISFVHIYKNIYIVGKRKLFIVKKNGQNFFQAKDKSVQGHCKCTNLMFGHLCFHCFK